MFTTIIMFSVGTFFIIETNLGIYLGTTLQGLLITGALFILGMYLLKKEKYIQLGKIIYLLTMFPLFYNVIMVQTFNLTAFVLKIIGNLFGWGV